MAAPQFDPQGFERPLDFRGAQLDARPPEGTGTGMTDSTVLARPSLLERDAELAAVGAFVASGGRLLVIEGPP